MRRKNLIADDHIQPIMVPRNDGRLVTMPAECAQRLREHLIKELTVLMQSKPSGTLRFTGAPRTNWLCGLCRADRLLAL
jgi:hypothetical protein